MFLQIFSILSGWADNKQKNWNREWGFVTSLFEHIVQ
jgi:hypothetical protein